MGCLALEEVVLQTYGVGQRCREFKCFGEEGSNAMILGSNGAYEVETGRE